MNRHVGPLLVGLTLVGLSMAAPATGDQRPRCRQYCVSEAGAVAVLSRAQLAQLPTWASGPKANPTTWHEYTSTTICTLLQPDEPGVDRLCTAALLGCTGTGEAGPRLYVWDRVVDATGPTTGWTQVGQTCAADAVPGGPPRPTLDMIRRAFTLTPWSKPTVTTQPANGTVLIGMPTYYQARFPAAGYGPHEVNTVNLLGYPVQIRPKLVGYTYTFGDGTTFGPTTSPGGTYPTGDITHTYTTPGTATPRITVTYSGEFRLTGEPWTAIPDTVDITGAPTTVTIREARSVLVSR